MQIEDFSFSDIKLCKPVMIDSHGFFKCVDIFSVRYI